MGAAAERMGMSESPDYDDRFRRLYIAHGDDLRAYCQRRLGGQDAEDALAEIFAIAWRRFDTVPDGNEARLWLYGVARNVIRNLSRSARRRQRLANRLSVGVHESPGAEESTVTRSEHEDVLAALDGLRPGDQEILRLYAWEELSRTEIAQILDISVGAVDMRLHRAMTRMSRALRSRELAGHTTGRAEGRGGKP